ncbi:DUF4255 domain-containing protein [Pseudomonas sp. R5(2019)]|uniref:DUF4255 domain-containing protein n=1 Tax=Pseudomonas sp. R5(2019) TaxID=2697566 RepID=UPI001412C756|nr:DUF4255 domain-containing protein [Pseudomonas sp. R5(2019)]NBA93502.1 DUF4255 domain-containing protein [Pseudomonas sp. R5(2019)]
MSSPLALAAVTATLCDLLNNGLINNDLSHVGSFSVTALPPDRIETGNTEVNRLNLFLYQVTPNPGWRNEGLPSHSALDPRARLSNPPLALDLHYLLTAYGAADWTAEILLGYAMELLHDARVLTRQNIRDALSPDNPINVKLIPADAQGRLAIDLAEQIEQIKIIPHYLSADELSRMWTAMQARYRPTMAYQVSTVLIQGKRSTRSALPVIHRGKNDHGVDAQPKLKAPSPLSPTISLFGIEPFEPEKPAIRLAAELGDTLVLKGALFEGDAITAEFRNPLLKTPNHLPINPDATVDTVHITLPISPDDEDSWPAGPYTVSLRIERAGKLTRQTNEWPFSLAPRLLPTPHIAGPLDNAQLTVEVSPKIWPGQRIDVFLGGAPLKLETIDGKTALMVLPLKDVVPIEEAIPVVVRVDGVDSQLIRDRSADPPQFDPQQCVRWPL